MLISSPSLSGGASDQSTPVTSLNQPKQQLFSLSAKDFYPRNESGYISSLCPHHRFYYLQHQAWKAEQKSPQNANDSHSKQIPPPVEPRRDHYSSLNASDLLPIHPLVSNDVRFTIPVISTSDVNCVAIHNQHVLADNQYIIPHIERRQRKQQQQHGSDVVRNGNHEAANPLIQHPSDLTNLQFTRCPYMSYRDKAAIHPSSTTTMQGNPSKYPDKDQRPLDLVASFPGAQRLVPRAARPSSTPHTIQKSNEDTNDCSHQSHDDNGLPIEDFPQTVQFKQSVLCLCRRHGCRLCFGWNAGFHDKTDVDISNAGHSTIPNPTSPILPHPPEPDMSRPLNDYLAPPNAANPQQKKCPICSCSEVPYPLKYSIFKAPPDELAQVVLQKAPPLPFTRVPERPTIYQLFLDTPQPDAREPPTAPGNVYTTLTTPLTPTSLRRQLWVDMQQHTIEATLQGYQLHGSSSHTPPQHSLCLPDQPILPPEAVKKHIVLPITLLRPTAMSQSTMHLQVINASIPSCPVVAKYSRLFQHNPTFPRGSAMNIKAMSTKIQSNIVSSHDTDSPTGSSTNIPTDLACESDDDSFSDFEESSNDVDCDKAHTDQQNPAHGCPTTCPTTRSPQTPNDHHPPTEEEPPDKTLHFPSLFSQLLSIAATPRARHLILPQWEALAVQYPTVGFPSSCTQGRATSDPSENVEQTNKQRASPTPTEGPKTRYQPSVYMSRSLISTYMLHFLLMASSSSSSMAGSLRTPTEHHYTTFESNLRAQISGLISNLSSYLPVEYPADQARPLTAIHTGDSSSAAFTKRSLEMSDDPKPREASPSSTNFMTNAPTLPGFTRRQCRNFFVFALCLGSIEEYTRVCLQPLSTTDIAMRYAATPYLRDTRRQGSIPSSKPANPAIASHEVNANATPRSSFPTPQQSQTSHTQPVDSQLPLTAKGIHDYIHQHSMLQYILHRYHKTLLAASARVEAFTLYIHLIKQQRVVRLPPTFAASPISSPWSLFMNLRNIRHSYLADMSTNAQHQQERIKQEGKRSRQSSLQGSVQMASPSQNNPPTIGIKRHRTPHDNINTTLGEPTLVLKDSSKAKGMITLTGSEAMQYAEREQRHIKLQQQQAKHLSQRIDPLTINGSRKPSQSRGTIKTTANRPPPIPPTKQVVVIGSTGESMKQQKQKENAARQALLNDQHILQEFTSFERAYALEKYQLEPQQLMQIKIELAWFDVYITHTGAYKQHLCTIHGKATAQAAVPPAEVVHRLLQAYGRHTHPLAAFLQERAPTHPLFSVSHVTMACHDLLVKRQQEGNHPKQWLVERVKKLNMLRTIVTTALKTVPAQLQQKRQQDEQTKD